MIHVEGLSYTYPANARPTVDNINFSVDKGEVLGFLGPSGSGKSTTQKILIKLLRGHQGKVSLIDKPLENWGSALYNYIGVCFELPNHYLKLTAEENLKFFGSFFSVPTLSAGDLLEKVGLKDHAKRRVSAFSKGMKNRLNFARALLNNPQVLFLDEPTSGLDPTTARMVKDVITDLKNDGKTIFMTTHNMADADELCDRVAFLSEGNLAAIDSPDGFKRKYGQEAVKVVWDENGKTCNGTWPFAGLAENERFLDALRSHGLRSVHSEEATLESVFIKVTGKRLTDEKPS